MKIASFVYIFLLTHSLQAQHKREKPLAINDFETGKYITFNPFAIFEPQATIGLGFGNRFSQRSEFYGELSYLTKTPFYDYRINDLRGYKIVTQYRYHFLQQWKPIINGSRVARERRGRFQPFTGIEFRFKNFSFSSNKTIYSDLPRDTISSYNYKTTATVIGGAIIFGSTYKISRNEKWNLEVTSGIGARHRFVKNLNLPAGYKVLDQRRYYAFRLPPIDEAIGLPYFPIAVKIKYILD